MSALDNDIEWHRTKVTELRASIVAQTPDDAEERELDYLRQTLARYEATLIHLEKLRRLTHAISHKSN